jgi:hypothetical protein
MRLRSTEEFLFTPPRRAGLLFLLGLILIFLGGAALGLYRASQAQIGPIFIVSMLPALLAVVFVPFLAYRLYCLQASSYILERDGLRLRWGLRVEHIPMSEILWVGRQSDYSGLLPLPVIRLPGAVVGVRQVHGAAQAYSPRLVEYMASESHGLILIGVKERIFAISPSDADSFLFDYQRFTELGSLTPLVGRSVYPSFLLGRVWRSLPARLTLLASLVLSLVLTGWVVLAIPAHTQVHLGFYPDGSPGDLVPAVQLLLLPVLNGIIVSVDVVAGLFFFRREQTQNLSYLLWGSSALVPLLFLLGVFFILQSS